MADALPPWVRRALRPIWLGLHRGVRLVTVDGPATASFLLSLRRDPSQVVEAWPPGGPELGGEAAIFVHYDPDGDVAARVLRSLDRLREAGLDVLFVSNAERLRPEAMALLQPRCAAILVRRNVGYDFGAMREALRHWRAALGGVRLLLIMNDSVLGPFAPLRPVLDRVDFTRADLWGAADSAQRQPHVQSWFVVVGRHTLDHPAWDGFWSRVRPVRHKAWVIGRYEVGLSLAMRRAGLRVQALWPYAAVVERAWRGEPTGSPARQRQRTRVQNLLRRGVALNPTADLWRELLECGCPFVKRELVERNPARVRDAAEWGDAVALLFGSEASPKEPGRR